MIYGANIGGVLCTMLSFGWLMLIWLFFLAGGIDEVLQYAVRKLCTGPVRKP